MGSRIYKPTRAGYVVLALIALLLVGIVIGVIIGGGSGATIDAFGGFLVVVFILLMVNPFTPRRQGDDPREEFPEPPGPGGLH